MFVIAKREWVLMYTSFLIRINENNNILVIIHNGIDFDYGIYSEGSNPMHSYEAPCAEGDWEKRGQWCPADTSYIAHSMCYTEEEY